MHPFIGGDGGGSVGGGGCGPVTDSIFLFALGVGSQDSLSHALPPEQKCGGSQGRPWCTLSLSNGAVEAEVARRALRPGTEYLIPGTLVSVTGDLDTWYSGLVA